MIVKWSGLADKDYYEYIAKYCLPSWSKLPGEKYIVSDLKSLPYNFLNLTPWEEVGNYDCDWINIHNNLKTKTNNFWRKMQSQVWAVRNIPNCDFVALIDTDIEVLDFDVRAFENEMDKFVESGHPWATGRSNSRLHDSGMIIFNMHHENTQQLIDEYQNIWDSGAILELKKSYDGHAVESMFEKWPSYKIMNTDYGKGFHVYDLGFVHYGSKIPKELRRNTKSPGQKIVKNYTKDKVIKTYKNN